MAGINMVCISEILNSNDNTSFLSVKQLVTLKIIIRILTNNLSGNNLTKSRDISYVLVTTKSNIPGVKLYELDKVIDSYKTGKEYLSLLTGYRLMGITINMLEFILKSNTVGLIVLGRKTVYTDTSRISKRGSKLTQPTMILKNLSYHEFNNKNIPGNDISYKNLTILSVDDDIVIKDTKTGIDLNPNNFYSESVTSSGTKIDKMLDILDKIESKI